MGTISSSVGHTNSIKRYYLMNWIFYCVFLILVDTYRYEKKSHIIIPTSVKTYQVIVSTANQGLISFPKLTI